MSLLEKIGSPEDLRRLDEKDLPALAEELRAVIRDTTAKNGGHFASNLGAVELTIALHRVFLTPVEKLVFDVGHQAYAHKLLTGRADRFSTLRRSGGLSGAPPKTAPTGPAIIAPANALPAILFPLVFVT